MIDNNRLLIALVLSAAILFGFQFLYEKPRQEALQQQKAQQQTAQFKQAEEKPETLRKRSEIIAETRRLRVVTPELHGSINLTGARLDDITLANYRETVDPQSPEIVLLSPAGSALPHHGYFAEFGWLSDNDNLALPGPQTQWQTSATTLTPAQPVTLTWDNGQGLTFERVIAVDDKFMFTVTDHVRNNAGRDVTLYPYGLISRQGKSDEATMGILHVGPIGMFNGTLEEHSYDSMVDSAPVTHSSAGGWIGITDKYWLVSLVPPSEERIVGQFRYAPPVGDPEKTHGKYQTDFRGAPVTLAAGGEAQHVTRFFAGAKRLRTLDHYEEAYNITRFDRAIDFGWFYFLTKPFLYALDWLAEHIGNTGVAILALTILIKLAVLPLGVRSYRSMARLKKLQPELQRLMARFKDDKMRQSMEMMELYKREKVSPFSGCIPILFQLPVFFALYKVLYVGIEMRHAPFFGWIKDLSAPDPTSLFNLFGLLPYDVPGFLYIGVWPILMGLSMFLQQKLSPQPPDPMQARIFMALPIIFTVMFGPTMASGLIIYWTWSNLISIAQQYFIYRRMGVKAT